VSIVDRIRAAAAKQVLYLPHAIRQMTRPDRMITPAEVEAVVATGEVIEDYPDDPRGHSSLLLGLGDQARPIHVLCSPKPDYLAIITAYLPDPTRWSDDYRSRR
jgi:uncharacterized protein DUF4258